MELMTDLVAHAVLGVGISIIDRKRSVNSLDNTSARIEDKKKTVVALEYLLEDCTETGEGDKVKITEPKAKDADYLNAVDIANSFFESRHIDVSSSLDHDKKAERGVVSATRKLGHYMAGVYRHFAQGREFNELRLRDRMYLALGAEALGDVAYGAVAGATGHGNYLVITAHSFLRTPLQGPSLVLGFLAGKYVMSVFTRRPKEERELDKRLTHLAKNEDLVHILKRSNETYAVDLADRALESGAIGQEVEKAGDKPKADYAAMARELASTTARTARDAAREYLAPLTTIPARIRNRREIKRLQKEQERDDFHNMIDGY